MPDSKSQKPPFEAGEKVRVKDLASLRNGSRSVNTTTGNIYNFAEPGEIFQVRVSWRETSGEWTIQVKYRGDFRYQAKDFERVSPVELTGLEDLGTPVIF